METTQAEKITYSADSELLKLRTCRSERVVDIPYKGRHRPSILRVARRPPKAIGITSATAWSIGTQFARRFW